MLAPRQQGCFELRTGSEKAVQNSAFSRPVLGIRSPFHLQSVYIFRIPPWQFPCSILVFLFCARPGPALSLAMFTTPHRAGQVRFVETAATPEDCCRRADDDSLSTQAPAWRDVAAVAVAVGDCRPLMATAASCGSLPSQRRPKIRTEVARIVAQQTVIAA